MKKNGHIGEFLCHSLKKTLFIMRIVVILLFVGFLQTRANDAYSQKTRLSIVFSNTELVTVLDKIEKQSEFYFLYNEKLIDAKRKVSIDAKDERIEEVLKNLFSGTDVEYSIIDRKIILVPSYLSESQQPSKKVSGKVTEVNGAPIPGVTVMVKGTTTGVITDNDGNYSLANIPANATLQYSFVGMKSQEVKIASQTAVNVVLVEESIGIEEVVAIGYGTKSKATVTGAISVINNDAITNRPSTKTTDLLQGISSGLQITRSNTGNIRGSQNSITIRGLTSRNAPGILIVLDGIPQAATDASALDNIDPNTIDNISVLKDGQASIYGARAAGGVILITTKAGITNKPTINFSATNTVQIPSLLPKIMNILDEWDLQHEAYLNDGQLTDIFTNNLKLISDQGITFDDIKNNPKKTLMYEPYGNNHPFYLGNYEWNKIMWKPALEQNYNLSVSGKRDNLRYYESVNYSGQDGMLAYGKNYRNRLSITLKNDYDITNWLKIKSNFNIGTIKMVQPNSYPQGETVQVLQPYVSPGHYMAIGGYSNPIANALAGSLIEPSYILNGTLGAELRPFKDLVIAGEISSKYNIQESDWSSIDYPEYGADDILVGMHFGGLNQAGAGYTRTRYTVGDINATYSYTKLVDHQIRLLAGYSHEENNYRNFAAYRQYGLISAELPTMGAGSAANQYNSESKTEYALNSAYSRLEYSYKNKYILEGIFRYDGTSKFAQGFKWSPFFGASGGWVITDENFMKNLKNVINFLKIRASWGQLGNQTGIGLYDYISQINVGGSYPMGSWLSPIQTLNATLGTMPSTTRTWEKVVTKNLGLDLAAFDSKLTGSFDYFIKDNKNMFFNQEYPQVLGTTAPNINGAHLRTKGYEVEIGWADKINDFRYSVKVNLSDNNNKIISLADAIIPSQGTNNFIQGYPSTAYFGYQYDGIIQTASELADYKAKLTGLPTKLIVGDVRYIDKNGDGKLTTNPYTLDATGKPTATSGDLVYLGEGGQHNMYGISVGLSWKGFDFSCFLQGVLQWNVINGIVPCSQWYNRIETYFYHNTWTPDRANALWPAVSQDGTLRNYNYQYSDAPYKLWNNRYIRLKNIQVGYTLPNSICERIHVNKLRFYVSGTDLWEHENLPGKEDPETPFGQNVSPFPRQISLGLSLTL